MSNSESRSVREFWERDLRSWRANNTSEISGENPPRLCAAGRDRSGAFCRIVAAGEGSASGETEAVPLAPEMSVGSASESGETEAVPTTKLVVFSDGAARKAQGGAVLHVVKEDERASRNNLCSQMCVRLDLVMGLWCSGF